MPSWRSSLANAAASSLRDLGARLGRQPPRLGDQVQRSLVPAHRQRGRRRDLAGQRERRAAARRGRRAARARARCASSASTERPASRKSRAAPWPTSCGEPPDVARAEQDAELAARDREPGAGRGDAHVARDRELHAGADRGAVDRGDHRRGIGDDRVEHLLERGPERVGRAASPSVGEAGAEIGARSRTRCPRR